MTLLKKITPRNVFSLFKQTTTPSNLEAAYSDETGTTEVQEEVSLERIKDLIIEAYAAIDGNRRALLLQRADDLQYQLVAIYRARGLQITADNICDTLESYRKRHFKHSYRV